MQKSPVLHRFLWVSQRAKVRRTFIRLLEANEKYWHVNCSLADIKEVNQSSSSLAAADLLALNRAALLSVTSGTESKQAVTRVIAATQADRFSKTQDVTSCWLEFELQLNPSSQENTRRTETGFLIFLDC